MELSLPQAQAHPTPPPLATPPTLQPQSRPTTILPQLRLIPICLSHLRRLLASIQAVDNTQVLAAVVMDNIKAQLAIHQAIQLPMVQHTHLLWGSSLDIHLDILNSRPKAILAKRVQ